MIEQPRRTRKRVGPAIVAVAARGADLQVIRCVVGEARERVDQRIAVGGPDGGTLVPVRVDGLIRNGSVGGDEAKVVASEDPPSLGTRPRHPKLLVAGGCSADDKNPEPNWHLVVD